MEDNYDNLSKLIKQFNDAAQKKRAFSNAMQKIFETLDEKSMDDFVEEEIKMQKIADDQKRAVTPEEKEKAMEEYFQLIQTSRFQHIRTKIAWLEEKYYEHAIDSFVEQYKKLSE